MTTSFVALAGVATVAILLAVRVWPSSDPAVLPHVHGDLAADDPHLGAGAVNAQRQHSHEYVVDDQHARWPM